MKRWLTLAVGLLLWSIALTACGSESQSPSPQGSPSASTGATEVHIVMTEMKIESDMTTFTHGQPYHFIIDNKGTIQHEFEIATKLGPDATEQEHDAASLKELQRLDPGKTQTLDYTFGKAYPAGTLEFECGIPDHYKAGMHMDVVVQ